MSGWYGWSPDFIHPEKGLLFLFVAAGGVYKPRQPGGQMSMGLQMDNNSIELFCFGVLLGLASPFQKTGHI